MTDWLPRVTSPLFLLIDPYVALWYAMVDKHMHWHVEAAGGVGPILTAGDIMWFAAVSGASGHSILHGRC